jgi:hypothetical protein
MSGRKRKGFVPRRESAPFEIRNPIVSGQTKQRPKNYLIITDAEKTEVNYFKGLDKTTKDTFTGRIKVKTFKGMQGRARELVANARRYSHDQPRSFETWCLFDYDKEVNFDQVINEVADLEDQTLKIGWTNPCVELWLGAYLGGNIQCFDSSSCIKNFKERYKAKTGREYKKNESNIYQILILEGDELKAIELATSWENNHKLSNTLPSKSIPGTTLHKLIKDIKYQS